MRKMIAVTGLVLAAALLGGCAGGGFTGGSPLPSANQNLMHHLDSVGGGPVPKSDLRRLDSVGGGPVPRTDLRRMDSVGGGPVVAHKRAHRLDSVGGGPVPRTDLRRMDSVGGGPVPKTTGHS